MRDCGPRPYRRVDRPTANIHEHAPVHISWARLLKRVFDIDTEHCPNCGGELKIIATIEQPAVIERILPHLGLPARAPPGAPAPLPELIHGA